MLTVSDRAILQRAGIFHAMALSGMHMSVLVGCLFLLRRRKRLRALLGIPICIAFAVITGCSPSVVRAAVLQCLLLAAGAFRRETDAPTSLSLAAGILIIQNPWVIMSWGAQLSFASVIGLMLFGRGMYTRLVKLVPRGILSALWKPVAATLSATLAALSLTAPLMVFEFGYISLIAPLTNLLCAWVVELCFAGCLLTALTGLLLPAVSSGMGWFFSWGFRYLRAVAGLLSRVPYAAIYTGSLYFLFWLILLYVIVAVLLLRPKTPKLMPACLAVFTLFVCIFLSLLESMVPSFTALNIGQGQCLLFQSGTASVMVDCGSANENAGTIAAEHLTAVGENELDLLILTHYDSDHISGTTDLLRQVRVKQLLLPATASPAREELERLAMEVGTEILHAEADTSIYLGKFQLEVFVPPEEHAADSAENDNSLAVLSRIPNLQVLITGDMDTIGEAQLLEGHTLPELDVLVAGHHGAKTSTSTRLLAAGKPKAVVISVGKNSYGHPAEEALHRIALSDAALYRTDEAGLSGCLTFRPGQQPAG